MSTIGRKRCSRCNTECQETEIVCWQCGAPFRATGRPTLAGEDPGGNCHFHPDTRAGVRCVACHRDLCYRCAIPVLRQVYCPKCIYLVADLPVLFQKMHQSAQEMARMAADKERITSELRIARDMQMSMMPKESPRIPGLEISGICHPAGNVGGDYYDYFPLSGGRLGVVVGDVTGKEVPAALLMAMAKSFLIAQMASNPEPTVVLRELARMVDSLDDRRRLMTFFYAVIDPVAHTVRFANAGHNYPYLIAGREPPKTLEAEGLPLGSAIASDYEAVECPLPAGAVLVLYSDGVVEAKGTGAELYGYARFERILSESRGLAPAQIRASIAKDIGGFLRSRAPDDDITIVVVKSA